MTSKLIFHDIRSINASSPFEDAIQCVIAGGHVDIACPYIGLPLLQGITRPLNRWRLLTDWSALLSIVPRKQARTRMIDWILANESRARHITGLHAKVVLGAAHLLIGSANLTDHGMLNRVEVGWLSDDPNAIKQMRGWFEQQWTQGVPPDQHLLQQLAKIIPLPRRTSCSAAANLTVLPASPVKALPTIDRVRHPLPASTIEDDPLFSEPNNGEDRLIRAIHRRATSRAWLEIFLDWVVDLVGTVGFKPRDRRLKISATSSGKLNISLNNRYALATGNLRDGWVYLMVRRRDVDQVRQMIPQIIADPAWFAGGTAPVTLVGVPFPVPENIAEQLRLLWHAGLKEEVATHIQHGGRRADTPALYKAAADSLYRRTLLDRCFPTNEAL